MNTLQFHRIDRSLSIHDLAASAGLSRAELVAVEAGERHLTREQAIDLAQRLRIAPEELAPYVR